MKQKYSSGSSHLVIVIALVIFMGGALGYVFVNNLSKTKVASSKNISTKDTNKTANTKDTIERTNSTVADHMDSTDQSNLFPCDDCVVKDSTSAQLTDEFIDKLIRKYDKFSSNVIDNVQDDSEYRYQNILSKDFSDKFKMDLAIAQYRQKFIDLVEEKTGDNQITSDESYYQISKSQIYSSMADLFGPQVEYTDNSNPSDDAGYIYCRFPMLSYNGTKYDIYYTTQCGGTGASFSNYKITDYKKDGDKLYVYLKPAFFGAGDDENIYKDPARKSQIGVQSDYTNHNENLTRDEEAEIILNASISKLDTYVFTFYSADGDYYLYSISKS